MGRAKDEEKECIKHCMKEWEHCPNRFKRISKKYPNYKEKQIYDLWRNYLDPELCQDPLTVNEKKYIEEFATKHRRVTKHRGLVINWRRIILDLKVKYGKLHSENKVKNYWNSTPTAKDEKQRRQNKMKISFLLQNKPQ